MKVRRLIAVSVLAGSATVLVGCTAASPGPRSDSGIEEGHLSRPLPGPDPDAVPQPAYLGRQPIPAVEYIDGALTLKAPLEGDVAEAIWQRAYDQYCADFGRATCTESAATIYLARATQARGIQPDGSVSEQIDDRLVYALIYTSNQCPFPISEPAPGPAASATVPVPVPCATFALYDADTGERLSVTSHPLTA